MRGIFVALGVLASWTWGLFVVGTAMALAPYVISPGNPIQFFRDVAAAIAVLGTWRVVLGPMQPSERVTADVHRVAVLARGLGAIALLQTIKVVDAPLLAPISGQLIAPHPTFRLESSPLYVLAMGIVCVAAPVHAGFRARVALEGGSVRTLRRACAAAAVACVLSLAYTAAAVAFEWPTSALTWILNPFSPFIPLRGLGALAFYELALALGFGASAWRLRGAPELEHTSPPRMRAVVGWRLRLFVLHFLCAVAGFVVRPAGDVAALVICFGLLLVDTAAVVLAARHVSSSTATASFDGPRRVALALRAARVGGWVALVLAAHVMCGSALFVSVIVERASTHSIYYLLMSTPELLGIAGVAGLTVGPILAWHAARTACLDGDTRIVLAPAWLAFVVGAAYGLVARFHEPAAWPDRDVLEGGLGVVMPYLTLLRVDARIVLGVAAGLTTVLYGAILFALRGGGEPEPTDPIERAYEAVELDD